MATRPAMTVQDLIRHLRDRLAAGVSPDALVGTYTSTGHLHPVTWTECWAGTPTESPGAVKLLTDELSDVDEAVPGRRRARQCKEPSCRS
jgi:hypothetical protein